MPFRKKKFEDVFPWFSRTCCCCFRSTEKIAPTSMSVSVIGKALGAAAKAKLPDDLKAALKEENQALNELL